MRYILVRAKAWGNFVEMMMNDLVIAFSFLSMVIAPCVAARLVCVSAKRAAAGAAAGEVGFLG